MKPNEKVIRRFQQKITQNSNGLILEYVRISYKKIYNHARINIKTKKQRS